MASADEGRVESELKDEDVEMEEGEVEPEDDTLLYAGGGGEKGEDAEERVEKKVRRTKEAPTATAVCKALAELRRGLVDMKKCVAKRANRGYFEPAIREPEPYDRLIGKVDALRARVRVLQAARRRAALPRYLRPEVRAFMGRYPVGEEGAQPALPELSKGKGVATKQTLSAYVYGYLGERCKKTGPHTYAVDEAMQELVERLVGEKRGSLDFGVVPKVVTSALIPGVKPLDEDVASYGDVLSYFATLKKPRVRSRKGGSKAKEVEDEAMEA
jgi:hypothetical protein